VLLVASLAHSPLSDPGVLVASFTDLQLSVLFGTSFNLTPCMLWGL
jgi:hypothetical protein